MMGSLIHHTLRHVKSVAFTVKTRSMSPRLKRRVPYFSQWESRELNGQILRGEVKAEDDPKWRGSGALSKAEYVSWSWSSCGMACLKMILAHRNNEIIPIVTLGKQCSAYGGYDFPLETSVGLKYAPFVRFLKQAFGITAKVVPTLPATQIVHELAQGNYVMASVSPMIRDPSSQPKTRSGHLILVVGYDLHKREFYLHNSSGDSSDSQEFAQVSFDDFKRFFSGRGIVVAGKKE